MTGTVVDSASAAVAFDDLLARWCGAAGSSDCGSDAAETVNWWG